MVPIHLWVECVYICEWCGVSRVMGTRREGGNKGEFWFFFPIIIIIIIIL